MNILIVDDEAGALRDLTRTVKKVVPEADIYSTRKVTEALELCRDKAFDVAFLDIQMPEIDGLTLVKEIQKLRPITNLIMVTAYPDYALDALRLYVSDYILKPAAPEQVSRALKHLRNPIPKREKGLFVQCFGNFEVFYDGDPIRFTRAKAKELFAYLIDRRGASASNAQLRSVLWLDENDSDDKHRNYFARIVLELKKTLENLGLSDIFIHSRDSYAIVPDLIPCDYYMALEKDAAAMSKYQGEYMTQYEWASYRIQLVEKQLYR